MAIVEDALGNLAQHHDPGRFQVALVIYHSEPNKLFDSYFSPANRIS